MSIQRLSAGVWIRASAASWHLASLVVLLLVCTGCSSFGRHWKQAGPPPAQPGDITGRWEGDWLSDVNGHHGRLRAVIAATPGAAAPFRIHYRATFLRCFRYSYSLDLRPSPFTNGVASFADEAKLGIWGAYRTRGTLTSTNLTATYESKLDRGTFRLSRPASTDAP